MAAKQHFDVAARLFTDFFEHLALSADDDAFLRIAFHVNGGFDIDPVLVGPFGKFLHRNRHRVRNFLPQQVKHLLPHQFRHQEPFRLIGQMVLREVAWSLWQEGPELGEKIRHALAGEGADGNDGVKPEDLPVAVDHGQQVALVADQVDLVDGQDHRRAHPLEAVQGKLGLFPARLEGIHQKADDIDLIEGGQGSIHHESVEFVPGSHDPGGIYKHELQVRFIQNAEQAIAGSLRPGGGNRDLLPEELIEQGCLADVRGPNEGEVA